MIVMSHQHASGPAANAKSVGFLAKVARYVAPKFGGGFWHISVAKTSNSNAPVKMLVAVQTPKKSTLSSVRIA